MRTNEMINAWIMLIIFIFGFGLLGCNSSSTSPKKELTEEQKRKMEGFDALEAKKSEYTTIPAKEQLVKEPYIKKSLLVYKFDSTEKIEKDRWKRNYFGTDKFGSTLFSKDYENLEFKLAKNPEEVGIIALMPECKEVKAGQYGSKVAAFQEECELLLIDPDLSAVVYKKTFAGEMDKTKTVSGSESSVTGRVDGKNIINFLDSLKQKTEGSSSNSNQK